MFARSVGESTNSATDDCASRSGDSGAAQRTGSGTFVGGVAARRERKQRNKANYNAGRCYECHWSVPKSEKVMC